MENKKSDGSALCDQQPPQSRFAANATRRRISGVISSHTLVPDCFRYFNLRGVFAAMGKFQRLSPPALQTVAGGMA